MKSPFPLVLLGLFATSPVFAGDGDPWPELTSQNKPWTRWWWLGSAVDKPNLTRELEAIAAAGFGGVEITPIYGAQGAEPRYLKFLSPEYVEMLAHVSRETKRLGMGVDMPTGTGWPFGGPNVADADTAQNVEFTGGKLQVKPAGMGVKRAAPGGEGPILNPYSPAAMSRYLERFTSALKALPAGALRSQFHDSFEYKGTWAAEVPAKFTALHGYNLQDHLSELAGQGDADTVIRIRADYRKAIEELHLDYIHTWIEWTHARGELARDQAHGSPANLLDIYASADIPETEIFGSSLFPIPGFRREPGDFDKDSVPPLVNRFASSAAHVAGHRLTSSETFTWLREQFREAPSEMKPEVDQLFLAGINHIFYHGTAYSPADAAWPGWLFYASTQANPRNPLWKELAGLNGYIARSQALLQSGEPDNDILLYWPVDDLWHGDRSLIRRLTVHNASWIIGQPCGEAATQLLAQGFSFDFVSDKQIQQTNRLNGVLKTVGGTYRTVVVPRTSHMPTATLDHLLELAGQGATILFLEAMPADVPGYGNLEKRRAHLKATLGGLNWGETDPAGLRTAPLGKGRVLLGDSLASLLKVAGVSREPITERGPGFIRRRLADGYLYFIANLSSRAVDGWVPLARAAHSAQLLDAVTTRSGSAAVRNPGNAPEVYLQLRPGESLFLKTRDLPATPDRPWAYFTAEKATMEIKGNWRLTFVSGGPELPASRQLSQLGSWAQASDAAAQAFAGSARYEIEFELPAGTQPDAWRLDLGDVRETAKVRLNGAEVAAIWSLPFDTLLPATLKPGRNLLNIEVTNTAANRIRDLDRRHVSWKIFREINFRDLFYQPFDASNWPLQPSGLLGPVRLIPLSAQQPGT